MKKLCILLALYLSCSIIVTAQFLNHSSVQVLLYGVVTDALTKQPVGLTIEFKTSSGKWFKIKSDSITGKYQQVFTAGEQVEATLYHWDVIRERMIINLPDTSKYAEIEKNFEVIKLEQGKIIMQTDAFPTQSSELTEQGRNFLLQLDKVLKFNRNVKLNIRVTAFDTYFKKYNIEERKEIVKIKGKKTTQIHYDTTIIEPSVEQIRQLVDSRHTQVQSIVGSIFRGRNRLFIIADYNPGDLIEKFGPNQPDILVEVAEIKNILEKK